MRGRYSPGHCASIEHRYTRTADPDALQASEDIEARRRALLVDEDDAYEVDRVIRGPTFPERERGIIEAHYLDGDRYQKTCRVYGIPFRQYDLTVARAVLMVRNRLATFERG